MQTAKQLSVSLVNKPGRLATLLAALSKEKVNFRALSVMDTGERGTLRFVPDDLPVNDARIARVTMVSNSSGDTIAPAAETTATDQSDANTAVVIPSTQGGLIVGSSESGGIELFAPLSDAHQGVGH